MPLLEARQNYFKTGRTYPKNGSEDVYVYEINCRRSIREKAFPSTERHAILSGRKLNDSPTGPGTPPPTKEPPYPSDQKKHPEPSKDGTIRRTEIVYATEKGKKRKRS